MYVDRVVHNSIPEFRFFKNILKRIQRIETDTFKIHASLNFSLTSLFDLDEIPKRHRDNWNLQWSSFDVVVFDLIVGNPIVVIELRGRKYHSSNNAISRDKFKENLCKHYKINFVAVSCKKASYGLDVVEKILKKYRERNYGEYEFHIIK